MERRQQDDASATIKQRASDRKGSCADDCGQLDNIIGGFGKYQLMVFMFKILIGATSAFNNLGVTFFAPTEFIGFWCADAAGAALDATNSSALAHGQASPMLDMLLAAGPPAAGANRTTAGSLLESGHHVQLPPPTHTFVTENIRQLLGDFVFSQERGLKRQASAYSSDTPKGLRQECHYLSAIDNERHKCTAYKYDTGIWISTIIDEWDLVCDRALYISIAQSLYMAGFIVSYLVFGYISDRFGRWNSLVLGALIEILSGFGCAFAGSAGSFLAFRFLLGLGNAGRSSSSYLIMIEWTGQAWRMHISTLGSLGWVIGYCAMPWIVLFFLHFRHMQLFVCFYEFIFLLWLLRLPESPRWLLTHHRFGEAYEVLLNAAKFNGLIINDKQGGPASERPPAGLAGLAGSLSRPSPSGREADGQEAAASLSGHSDSEHSSLRPYTMEEFDLKFARLSGTISQKEFLKNEDRLSILDLFRWPNLRRYMFILAFAWAINSFIYYGIALRVGDFGAKNLFVSFTFAGATELPSIAFTMACMKFLPRRTTNIFLFSVIFLLCALQVPLKYYDLPWLQQITMMLAKLFNSCSFTCILYQTMELFPTSIRQTAYSSCSLAGRVGSILAPFIKELSQVTNALVPPIIYAVLSILEIFYIRYLPETQGSDLPDTLLEAESFKGTNRPAASNSRGPTDTNGKAAPEADDHHLSGTKMPV